MSLRSRVHYRPPPHFNSLNPNEEAFSKRISCIHIGQKHATSQYLWKQDMKGIRPFGINCYVYTPRMLRDRDFWRDTTWEEKRRLPDTSRWEKLVDGKRVTEDRWALVEEDGEMHKVSWKLYCQRVETEMKAAYDSVPQFRHWVTGIPDAQKRLEPSSAVVYNLSLREALAQCKMTRCKGRLIQGRLLEMSRQGAEMKGLDKEKIRVVNVNTLRGKTDKAIDIRSKGYFAWKTLRSSEAEIILGEDPEMVLPDRTSLPYSSQLALRKAGIATSTMEIIDVPAITAEGI
jgi:hypothetical protein